MKLVDVEELEKQGWQLTRTVRASDPNRMIFETKKLTDCFCIDRESDPAYETCDDCVHSADSVFICQLRGCIHAATIYGLHECYKKRQEKIVQCKNCKYSTDRTKVGCTLWNWNGDHKGMSQEDFCSRGERRDNDGTD